MEKGSNKNKKKKPQKRIVEKKDRYETDDYKPNSNLRSAKRSKENNHKFPGVTTHRNMDLIIGEIMRLRVEGVGFHEIINRISENHQLAKSTVGTYYQSALEEIKGRVVEISDTLIMSHSSRYDEIYRWYRDNGYDRLALKCLAYKEKLMGVGQESFEMIINNFFEPEKSVTKIDTLDPLSSTEKLELSTLLSRCEVKKISI